MILKREHEGTPKLQDQVTEETKSAHVEQPKVSEFPPDNPEKYRLGLSNMKAMTQGLMILRDVAVDFPQE